MKTIHPKAEKFRMVISKYVPENSVEYVVRLWLQKPFNFKITQARQTKHGDYQFNPRDRSHSITLNGSLNPYLFLITYIHEVAHLRNFIQYGRRVTPHGPYWKEYFKILIRPVMNEYNFPPDILIPLKEHMINPKASSDADNMLTRALHRYDRRNNGNIYLESIRPGEKFILSGKVYKKIQTKRTRALCREIHSGKEYLIPELLNIERFR